MLFFFGFENYSLAPVDYSISLSFLFKQRRLHQKSCIKKHLFLFWCLLIILHIHYIAEIIFP